MAIIISSNGNKAVKVEKSSIDKEDYLQKYIYENPESIPLYDIKEDIRLLILAREFPTESGPIDALGIDGDGNIYLIETKLYNNADKRRVVAQALDYGASLWKHTYQFDQFLQTLDKFTQKTFKANVREKIQDFYSIDDEESEQLISNISKNLSDGNIKFVILMDKLDNRLKDLILYVNQNSKFDIYAVEFEYYKHNQQEIVIPKLYGGEVKKTISNTSTSVRNTWNEQSLLDNAKETLNNEQYKAFENIFVFSKKHADKINYGTGAYASFSPIFNSLSDKSIFSLSTSPNYSFGLNFEWIAKNGREDTAKLLKEKMASLGFSIPDDYMSLRPSVSIEEWVPKAEQIISKLEEMLRENSEK